MFPVIALLLGYGAKYLQDWSQDSRTSKRERETRRALRQDAIAERRTQFQRQTLLELQPALTDLGRYTYLMYHHDVNGHRATGVWHFQPYPDDLDEKCRAATALISMLSVRVNDTKV